MWVGKLERWLVWMRSGDIDLGDLDFFEEFSISFWIKNWKSQIVSTGAEHILSKQGAEC